MRAIKSGPDGVSVEWFAVGGSRLDAAAGASTKPESPTEREARERREYREDLFGGNPPPEPPEGWS